MSDVIPQVERDDAGIRRSLRGLITKAIDVARMILTGDGDDQQAQRAAVYAFSVRVASAAIVYFSQVLLARWLGTFEYGIFVFVWAAVLVAGGIASMGFSLSIARFVPEYRAANEMRLLRGIIFAARTIPVAVSTGVAILGAGIVWLLGDHIEPYYLVPLILATTCLPLYTIMEIHDGIARAHSWILVALLPVYIVRPALLLVLMIGGVLMGVEATAVNAMYMAIASLWVAMIVQILVTNRRLAQAVEKGPKTVKAKYWTKVSLPITLVDAFVLFMFNADVLLLSALRSPEEVGVYFAAAKTLALVSFVTFAVAAASAHKFSEYYAKGDMARLETFVRNSVAWTFWPSLIGTVFLLAFGKLFLSLFGEEFVSGYSIMFVLAAGHLVRALVGPLERLLNVTGYQSLCAKIYICAFVVNIGLNLTLIPIYGVIGAATATTVAYLLESILLAVVVKRQLGLNVMIWSSPLIASSNSGTNPGDKASRQEI